MRILARLRWAWWNLRAHFDYERPPRCWCGRVKRWEPGYIQGTWVCYACALVAAERAREREAHWSAERERINGEIEA
jgi:hypothetical protein